jgi:hypothetical protein
MTSKDNFSNFMEVVAIQNPSSSRDLPAASLLSVELQYFDALLYAANMSPFYKIQQTIHISKEESLCDWIGGREQLLRSRKIKEKWVLTKSPTDECMAIHARSST